MSRSKSSRGASEPSGVPHRGFATSECCGGVWAEVTQSDRSTTRRGRSLLGCLQLENLRTQYKGQSRGEIAPPVVGFVVYKWSSARCTVVPSAVMPCQPSNAAACISCVCDGHVAFSDFGNMLRIFSDGCPTPPPLPRLSANVFTHCCTPADPN